MSTELRGQLEALKSEWALNSARLAEVDGEMAPLRQAYYRLWDQLKRTHRCRIRSDEETGRTYIDVLAYDGNGAEERFGLFAQLDAVCVVLGPLKKRRQRLYDLNRYFQGKGDELQSAIDNPPKPPRKPARRLFGTNWVLSVLTFPPFKNQIGEKRGANNPKVLPHFIFRPYLTVG
jgi:hypothetical protein